MAETTHMDREALAKCKPQVAAVEIPGHGTAYVRGMDGAQRDQLELMMAESERDGERDVRRVSGFRTKLVLWCACDLNGGLLYDADNPDDDKEVAGLDAVVRDRLAEAVLEASGLGDAVVKDDAGNSGGAPSD